MANIVQVEAQRMLDTSLGTTNATTAPATPLKLALVTTTGSSTTAGTEVTNAGGSTYARQTLAVRAASAGSGGTAGLAVTTNNGAVTFTNMPDTSANSVKGIDVWENGGRRVWFAALATPKATGLGDTLTFSDSALAFSDG